MEQTNLTPFPALAWESVDANNQWYITTLVRVKYVFHQAKKKGEWKLRLTPEQGELFAEDIYYNDDNNPSIQYESDLVTYKKNTDIIINATTYSPNSIAQKQWQCGVSLISPKHEELLTTELNICGSHQWGKKKLLGWIETDIEPAKSINIHYEKAYGGAIVNPEADQDNQPSHIAYDETNPVGTGIRHKKMIETHFPSHQITWADSTLEKKPHSPGFGFINRAWQPRLSHAGSYDKNWLDNQHPLPPHDFDYAHHQAANPELIMAGYLQAGSKFHLTNLMKGVQEGSFRIPHLHCFTDHQDKVGNTKRYRLNIDTVIVDIEDDDPKNWAVYLSYRHRSVIKESLQGITMQYLPSEILKQQQERNHG